MSSDIILNENTIELANAEVQNTGPLAGYAFRDRNQPVQQRWVLYGHSGDAHLFADSRGGDVVNFSKDGRVSTTGPDAGFQMFDRLGPAKGNAVWYVSSDGVNLDYTGPVQGGQVLKRLAMKVSNASGVTIFNRALVTGGFTAQGATSFHDRVSVDGDLVVDRDIKIGGTISQSSSAALKDDVEMLSGDSAIEALEELTPVTFRYKADPTRRRNVGFIAEEAPELVSHPKRDRISVMDIVAVLTKVVKEQQSVITALRSEVRAYGGRVEEDR
jgi:hypothetical protein